MDGPRPRTPCPVPGGAAGSTWYAAWDLALHLYPLVFVDLDFAKGQLDLMLRERDLHPNGQIPAYEWNFGDVNPPVRARAALLVMFASTDSRSVLAGGQEGILAGGAPRGTRARGSRR
jgi:hypothetical protein